MGKTGATGDPGDASNVQDRAEDRAGVEVLTALCRRLAGHTRRLDALLARIEARGVARRVREMQLASGDWVERTDITDIKKASKAPLWHAPKADRAKCGARTRKGTPCQCPVVWGRERCRLHGGCSTGPKTEAGRERIRESNRRRAEARRQAEAKQAGV